MNLATEVNREILGQIAAESIAKLDPESQDGRRWINAIAKATAEIERNPYMTFDPESKSLLMMSETSGKIYQANGTCGCRAFQEGYPCRHRAAARLMALYVERTR